MQNAGPLILVVEDEALTQELIQEALSEGGYQTKIIPSGEEAIQFLEADKSRVRALLTDIKLVGTVTGWDVAKRARELHPMMPVIYTSGVLAEQWPTHGISRSVLLKKPFAPAQVVTALSQLLNRETLPAARSRRDELLASPANKA